MGEQTLTTLVKVFENALLDSLNQHTNNEKPIFLF